MPTATFPDVTPPHIAEFVAMHPGLADINKIALSSGGAKVVRDATKATALHADPYEAQRFLNALGCNNNTRFRTFDDTKKGGIYPACYPPVEFKKLQQENNKGAGVFVVVNETTGDSDKDITGIRAIFADLDGVPLETVLAAGLRPHIIIESSPGRYHTYWKVNDCSLAEFAPIQKAIARRFKSDHTIFNPSRVMRLPGFIHRKKDPFKTSIMEIHDFVPYNVQQIIEGLGLQIGGQKEQKTSGTSDGDAFQGNSEGGRTKCIEKAAGVLFHRGFSVEEAVGFCETLDLAKNRPPLAETTPGKVRETCEGIHRRYYTKDQWPEPSPLPEGLSPVKKLHPDMAPAPLRGWVCDIAHRMQCSVDFVMAAVIVAVASVIGRGCGIYPKRHDNWLVVPNLYGAVVGDPSQLKTPAIAEGMRPLKRLEIEAKKLYQQEMETHEINDEVVKIQRAAIHDNIKNAVKKNPSADVSALRAELARLQNDKPIRRRYMTQDGTTEMIAVLMNQNRRGILTFRDELTGWFTSMDKPGHESDRGFHLEAWNGDGRYTYDRIGRGTLDVDALCQSVFGAMTPGPLSVYIRATVRGGIGDDGLLQRFQVLVYPDMMTEWVNIDRYPDTEQKNRAYEIFRKLSGDIPGAVQEDDDAIPALRFSAAGQEIFDQWRHKLETRLRGNHGLLPAMVAHLAKFRSLMPSLALIFHLIEVADGTTPPGPVSEVSAVLAVRWCEYLESHAARVYGAATMPGLEAAREIIKHIRRGVIKDGCKPKDIYRHQWSRLTTPEDVRAGLDVLAEYDWLIVERTPSGNQGGRPSENIRLNPNIKLD